MGSVLERCAFHNFEVGNAVSNSELGMTYAEAIAFAMEELDKGLRLAKSYDSKARPDILHKAFPKGSIPQIVDGRWYSIAAVPDDGSHEPLLLQAAESDRDSYDAALLRAQWLLLDERPLSRPFRNFLANVLAGNIKPKGKSGARSTDQSHQAKNQVIAITIDKLRREGFGATAQDAADYGESACDIVANAMTRLKKRPSSYQKVYEIYKKTIRVDLID